MTTLYRKRLIPPECINLSDDCIIDRSDNKIITKWKTIRPKSDFSHGISYYCLNEGWKISKFFKEDNSTAYIYCDIIDTSYEETTDTFIFTDLLADVIIENDGQVRVVDLNELADACESGIISNKMLVTALYRLNALLSIIYNGKFEKYINILGNYESSL